MHLLGDWGTVGLYLFSVTPFWHNLVYVPPSWSIQMFNRHLLWLSCLCCGVRPRETHACLCSGFHFSHDYCLFHVFVVCTPLFTKYWLNILILTNIDCQLKYVHYCFGARVIIPSACKVWCKQMISVKSNYIITISTTSLSSVLQFYICCEAYFANTQRPGSDLYDVFLSLVFPVLVKLCHREGITPTRYTPNSAFFFLNIQITDERIT